MRKIKFCTLVVFILSGCATTANYEKKLRSWVGLSSDDLVRSWGYPTNTQTAPNGNKLLVYQKSNTTQDFVYHPAGQPDETANYTYNQYDKSVTENRYYKQKSPATYTTHSCNTYFEVDQSNKIVRWAWEGNACTSN